MTRRVVLVVVLVVVTVALSWMLSHQHEDQPSAPSAGDVPSGLS